MLSHSPYRLLGSLALLLLFLLPLGMREAHYLWEKHEALPACEATGNDRHLHGEELKHHDCTLCLIHYTQYLEAAPPAVHSSRPSPRVDNQFGYSFFHNHPSLTHIRERGPPCFACSV